MTKEQKQISKFNHDAAALYFNLQPGYVLHHIDPSWRHNDIERYIQWNIDDLIVMLRCEHTKLHHTGSKRSLDARDNMSKNHADVSGDKNPMYGNHRTDEEKDKMRSAAIKFKVRLIEEDIVFNSLRDAAKYVNGSHGHISNCCKGKEKSYLGLHWEFAD